MNSENIKRSININKASEKELYEIIHIGPIRAQLIVEKRPFRDLYELSNIKGLGRKRVDDIILEKVAHI